MKRNLIRFNLLLVLVITTLSAPCCVQMNPDQNIPESPVGLIPKDFDWKTVSELSCTINVIPVTGIGDNMIRIIRIFNSPLLNDGALIASGAAKPSSPFIVKITLPTALPAIYIQEILPNGVRNVKKIDVIGANLNISFSQSVTSGSITLGASIMVNASPAPSILVPTNFDVIIDNNSEFDLTGFSSGNGAFGNTYKSYLIPTGFTRTGDINMSNWLAHSILYVKGTLDLNSHSIDLNKSSIVVLDGGVVNVKGINTGSFIETIPIVYLQSNATLTSSKSVNLTNGVTFVNKGTFSVNDDMDVNGSSKFYNEGTFRTTKNNKTIYVTNNSMFYNSGNIEGEYINLSVNATFLNDESGTIESTDWYQTNSTVLTNHHEIVATKTFKTSGGGTVNNFCNITTDLAELQGSTINLFDGSLFDCQTLKTNNMSFNMTGGSMLLIGTISDVYGMSVLSSSAGYSVFKCVGNIPDLRWANTVFNGKIELVHANLVDGSGANGRLLYPLTLFTNGAILSKTQTKNIVASACNDAAGQIDAPPPVITDVDGDGVAAGTDVDDNDPSVAFVSYFPSASVWGTYIFEDLWPLKGDYDVNDMVILFKISYFTNSSNLLTKLRFDYNMKAAGCSYNLGTAFQLDNVLATNISSVTGQDIVGTSPFATVSNGTESGVSLAVIPLFNNHYDMVPHSGYLNTENGINVITPDKYVSIRFVTPIQPANVSINSFNIFIVANERGREIHLPSFSATSKFNVAFASGGQLYPGDNFKNIDGMMWGLMIPEPFDHPLEANTIISAYNHFAEWATSGGLSYPDWYQQKPGYINQQFIYQP